MIFGRVFHIFLEYPKNFWFQPRVCADAAIKIWRVWLRLQKELYLCPNISKGCGFKWRVMSGELKNSKPRALNSKKLRLYPKNLGG